MCSRYMGPENPHPPYFHPVNTLLVSVHHKQHIWCDNGTSQREPPSCKKTDSPLLFTVCYHGNMSINHTSQRWPDPRFLPGSRASKMKPFQFTCWHTAALSLLTISRTHTHKHKHKLIKSKKNQTCTQTRMVCMSADTVKHKHICTLCAGIQGNSFAIFCKLLFQHISHHGIVLFFIPLLR